MRLPRSRGRTLYGVMCLLSLGGMFLPLTDAGTGTEAETEAGTEEKGKNMKGTRKGERHGGSR